MKWISKLAVAIIAATTLAACASAPQPTPQRYSGELLLWFEGQSFRADGETETWAYGMSPEAMQQVAAAYPEGYAPSRSHTVIAVDVEGVLRPVPPETRRYGCVGGCYDHYLAISRVHSAHLLRSACPPIERLVFFGSNQATLDASAAAIIEDALSTVRQDACNVSRVRVVGHTDTVGAATQNLALSQARADAVREALIALGMDAALITAEGMGEELLRNRTADNVAEPFNRVVEIVIESPTAETAAPR